MKIRNIVEVLSFFLGRFRLELRHLKTLWNKHSFSKRKSVIAPRIYVKRAFSNDNEHNIVIPEDMDYLINRANMQSNKVIKEEVFNRHYSPEERIRRSHTVSQVIGAAYSEISKFML